MWASDFFQVIHGDVEAIGELTCTGSLPYGTWMDDFGDGVNAVNATGDIIGFTTQPVTLNGPTFEQMTLGYRNLPAKSGTKVSLARVQEGGEIEVEDAIGQVYNTTLSEANFNASNTGGQGLLVTSGAGSLVGCANGTLVSAKNGRLYVAQSGDFAMFKVINPNVTPIVDTVNNIRLRLKKIQGYKVP